MADTCPQSAQITFTMKAFPSFKVSLDAEPLLKQFLELSKKLFLIQRNHASQSVDLPFSKGHSFGESAATLTKMLHQKLVHTR